jgi:hypothetical protein
MRGAARGALLVAALGCSGCEPVTEIVVRVDSDLRPGERFTTPTGASVVFAVLRFKLDVSFGEIVERTDTQSDFNEFVTLDTSVDQRGAGAHLPVELAVVARGDWRERDFGIEVRGQAQSNDFDRDDEEPFIYQRALARFRDGAVLLLPIRLHGLCAVDGTLGTPQLPCSGARQACDSDGGTRRCRELDATLPLDAYSTEGGPS